MKNILKYLYFVLIVIGFVGCEQDTELDPPKYEKKPSINCFLCPESPNIYAELCYTKPYFGVQNNENDYILDAKVYLFDLTNLDSSELILSSATGIYKSTQNDIQIVENHQYLLKVVLPGGKVYFAKSTVPAKADLSKFSISYMKVGAPILDSNNMGPGGPGLYYERNPFTVEYYYNSLIQDNFYLNTKFEAEMINKNSQILSVEMMNKGENDFYQSNSEGKVRIYYNRDFNSGFGTDGPWEVNRISGTVYTVDAAYKNFYISQDNGQYAGLFKEPIIMISNWSTGAIGFFGSYNYTTGEIYKK